MSAPVITPPPVLAPAGTVTCNERYEGQHGVRCDRPKGHGGGHLSQATNRYWQAS